VKGMSIRSKGNLKMLMEQHRGPCISLYLPTHRTGTEMQQDRTRLKNQMRQAENLLFLTNVHVAEVEDLLEPIQALVDDEPFWLHPSEGLALFRSRDVFDPYRLPFSFQELVVVSNHFYLKPLLPFLSKDGRFYILALSQNDVRLFEGTHFSIHEVELPGAVPEGMAEVLRYDQPEHQLQYQSSSSGASAGKGGRQAMIFREQGVVGDDTREQVLRYFRQIDKGLQEVLRDETAPLVLAGVAYLNSLYRAVNTYPHLLDRGIAGNPDTLKAETLHEQVWALVEPYVSKPQQDAAAQYKHYAATERASNNARKIIPAAYDGCIESLFVASDQEQWGTFDPATRTMHVHRQAKFRDEDLLDLAATQTLLHGGSVYAVEREHMPDTALVAAVFRS
jgi:hypothetical protein